MRETREERRDHQDPRESAGTSLSLEFSVLSGFRDAVRRVENVFTEQGFELALRLDLAELVRDRAGIETPPSALLVFLDPLLMLQSLLAQAEASLLSPLTTRLTAGVSATHVCVFCAWPNAPKASVSDFLAEQARGRVLASINRLRATRLTA